MVDEEKTAAVLEYLDSEFPGCVVEDWYESARAAQSFRISTARTNHLATVLDEFFVGWEASKIGPVLKGFLLAEHLRDLGSTRVIVASDGLKLEY
jgi:hypothetical protein